MKFYSVVAPNDQTSFILPEKVGWGGNNHFNMAKPHLKLSRVSNAFLDVAVCYSTVRYCGIHTSQWAHLKEYHYSFQNMQIHKTALPI